MHVLLPDFPEELSDDFKRIAASLRPKSRRNELMMVVLENFIRDEREADAPAEFIEEAISRPCKPTLAPATA